MTVLLVAMFLGCSAGGEPPAPAPAPEPAPLSEAPAPAATTPEERYAACEGRVEQPEADGECASDADCATAGCSQEVCLPASQAADWSTTCEVLDCFADLDRCGCVDGRCRWSLKGAP